MLSESMQDTWQAIFDCGTWRAGVHLGRGGVAGRIGALGSRG